MSDESNTEIVVTTPTAEAAPPKKRRGSRPKKVVSEATAEMPAADGAETVKVPGKRAGKPIGKAASVQGVAPTKEKKPAKGLGKTELPKQSAPASVPVLDDIADLRQLEEENARLRKALSEKLRAENADLRKRLGLA